MTQATLLPRSERNGSMAGLASLAVLGCLMAPALTRSIPQPVQPGGAPSVRVNPAPATLPASVAAAIALSPRTAAPGAGTAEVEAAPAAAEQASVSVEGTGLAAREQRRGLALPSVPAGLHTRYYAQLRDRLRWVPVRVGGEQLETPDLGSRLLLAQSAAQRAGLDDVGLDHRDVYGIINAETSWIPRTGASKDGTPNLGIAQFEPATAKALGLANPEDPVEAIHVAAVHLKEAAEWSAKRIAPLKLSPQEHALKLREGVSIYYNLSTRGRNVWNGRNTEVLPRETQLHIQNARKGMKEAATLEAQLGNVRRMARNSGSDVALAALTRSGS